MERTDKENHIAVNALHKCEIERAPIFELCVFFEYCTVQLFLDTRGVSDRKRSDWPRMVHKSQVINAVRSRINQNPVQKQKKSWLEEWILCRDTMSHIIKQDLRLSNDKQDAFLLH